MDTIAVAMERSHFLKSYDKYLRLRKTNFMNWLKTCRKIILRHLNLCLKKTLHSKLTLGFF